MTSQKNKKTAMQKDKKMHKNKKKSVKKTNTSCSKARKTSGKRRKKSGNLPVKNKNIGGDDSSVPNSSNNNDSNNNDSNNNDSTNNKSTTYLNSFKLDSSEKTNPLKNSEMCTLRNRKKHNLYVHTYNPTNMINDIRTKLNIPDVVLDRFDDEIRHQCCNVISISLYFKDCNDSTMEKYLYSILRSVQNVEKNLKDYVVRVYFDTSVYNCIDEKDHDSEIRKTFEQIMNHSIVEVYTYLCSSFKDKSTPIERSRTLRFLPMYDSDVNICIIREADGIVSNLDCHNIKMFCNSDKLFYLPACISEYNNLMLEGYDMLFQSYSAWLIIYKIIFEQSFFSVHQNLYDLLAGTFSVKIKLKKTYYQKKVMELEKKINTFLLESKSERKEKIKNVTFWYPGNDYKKIANIHEFIDDKDDSYFETILNIGFDEILLLDIFKELISIKIIREPSSFVDYLKGIRKSSSLVDKHNKLKIKVKDIDTTQIENLKSIMYSDIIKLFTFEKQNRFELLSSYIQRVFDSLKSEGILDDKVTLTLPKIDNNVLIISYKNNKLFLIDSLLSNIIYSQPFNIQIDTFDYLSELLNTPYSKTFDSFYDGNLIS